MRKLSLMLILVAAVLSLTAIPAFADQLGLGGGTPGVYFCNIGGNIYMSTTSGCTTTGGTIGSDNSGNFQSPNHHVVIDGQPWSFGLPTFGWVWAVYDLVPVGAPPTNSFSWGGNGVEIITGTITWSFLSDGSASSKLVGSMKIDDNANGGLLGIDFPEGASVLIDYTFSNIHPTVGGLLGLGDGHSSGIAWDSSGEVPSVPEPGTLLLLGAGLVVAGTFLRRRGRAQPG